MVKNLFIGNIFSAQSNQVKGQVCSPFKAVMEGKFSRIRYLRIIQNNSAEIVTFFKTSDFSEKFTAAFGTQIKRLVKGKRFQILIPETPL